MSAPAAAAVVKLHRGLYLPDAINDAAATFADFARFAIETVGEHYVVAVSDVDPDVDGDVVAEFCNFALANTAVRRKHSHA